MIPAYYLEAIVVGLGLVLLLGDAFVEGRDKRWLWWLGLLGLAVVFALTFFARGGEGGFWNYYTYETGSFAGFYKGLALLATMLVLFMSRLYLPVVRSYTAENYAAGEFFTLPIFTCAGLMWSASATDLISIFVSIELVTVSFYVLAAFMRRNLGSLEAGVKYLILGALSTGFLVYGITWIVGVTGETNLAALGQALEAGVADETGLLFGFALLLVGLGFKVGAFPFNIWIPDVYQGAPTPVTAFLSVASKAAGFIVLLRVLEPFLGAVTVSDEVTLVLAIISVATVLFGSLVAMVQSNFKRLLAYSSISHAGFLLVAVSCSPTIGLASATLAPANVVAFYLASYLLMTMLAFFVVAIVRRESGGEDLNSFDGLGQRSPFLAFTLLVAVVSLAGVPLTAGFFGKFFVFQLVVEAKAWWLLAAAILAAACGFYYYLKVVRAMYFREADASAPAQSIAVGPMTKIIMTLLMVGIFGFGINPSPLLNLGTLPAAESVSLPEREEVAAIVDHPLAEFAE